MTDADVAVVGAGPAGAWAACRLARAGARVLLLDPSHPREKPCGGGLTARALALVAEGLGPGALDAVPVRLARFEAGDPPAPGDPPPVEVPLDGTGGPPAPLLAVASRTAFDGALLAAAVRAGARHVPERVVDVEAGAGGARLRTAPARAAAPGPGGAPAAGARTWRAGWVLGADGANSLVRRRLGRPFARGDLSIGTGVFAHGVTGDRIAVALVADPPGYLWAFPRPDHLAVGIGAQADAGATSAALRARAAAWLRRSGWAPPGAPLEPYAWPIPALGAASLDAERPAGPGWLLLGDAAGLVDPLTREGIYFALLSGALAADALAGPDPGGRYRERLGDEVYPELRRAAALRDGFFRPAFARLLLEALARSARIREVMADLVGGRQPYRGLRRRLLATREVGLALRLLALYLVPKSRSPASPRPGTM